MSKSLLYVGLDVHKKTIVVAIAESAPGLEVRHYGTIPNTSQSVTKMIRKLVSTGVQPCFAYEAGPCGYELYRQLESQGLACIVVAPSLIPKRNGDRIKTDKRDAINLARLFRAGELTSVYVPNIEDEAMRDLSRARSDAKDSEKKAKQKLGAFLLRHGKDFSGSNWSKMHFTWLDSLKMEHPAQQVCLKEYIDSIKELRKRVMRLEKLIIEHGKDWSRAPLVRAYQAFRGIKFVTATTIASELVDLERFKRPSELMSFLGLVPSEHSSGEKQRRGGITKTGNTRVRKALVESAWSYRLPARKTVRLLQRQKGLPESVKEISWKAQLRLCSRLRRFLAKGKKKQVGVVAIARELAAFIWSMDREMKRELRSGFKMNTPGIVS